MQEYFIFSGWYSQSFYLPFCWTCTVMGLLNGILSVCKNRGSILLPIDRIRYSLLQCYFTYWEVEPSEWPWTDYLIFLFVSYGVLALSHRIEERNTIHRSIFNFMMRSYQSIYIYHITQSSVFLRNVSPPSFKSKSKMEEASRTILRSNTFTTARISDSTIQCLNTYSCQFRDWRSSSGCNTNNLSN
jgi:hypothetical protein